MCSASAEFEDFVLQFMDRYVWSFLHQKKSSAQVAADLNLSYQKFID